MKIGWADIVIEKTTGDIGRVVALDDSGRTHRVMYRNGEDNWHYEDELYRV